MLLLVLLGSKLMRYLLLYDKLFAMSGTYKHCTLVHVNVDA